MVTPVCKFNIVLSLRIVYGLINVITIHYAICCVDFSWHILTSSFVCIHFLRMNNFHPHGGDAYLKNKKRKCAFECVRILGNL